MGRKARPEHVGDVHELMILTDRAGGPGRITTVMGVPPQLGLGVTHLVARQGALPIGPQNLFPGKPIVDLTRRVGHGIGESSLHGHPG